MFAGGLPCAAGVVFLRSAEFDGDHTLRQRANGS
jgi:hypothetical protein